MAGTRRAAPTDSPSPHGLVHGHRTCDERPNSDSLDLPVDFPTPCWSPAARSSPPS